MYCFHLIVPLLGVLYMSINQSEGGVCVEKGGGGEVERKQLVGKLKPILRGRLGGTDPYQTPSTL